jgi:peptidylprolyl isomerase
MTVLLSACDSSSGARNDDVPHAHTAKVVGPHGVLTVRWDGGPSPKELIRQNLRLGSGAEAKAEYEVVVNYVGLDYRTGKPFYDTWENSGPSSFHLKAMRTGWELGLRGMKPGGIRQLIVPGRLAYGTGPLVYLVEMLRVKRWES